MQTGVDVDRHERVVVLQGVGHRKGFVSEVPTQPHITPQTRYKQLQPFRDGGGGVAEEAEVERGVEGERAYIVGIEHVQLRASRLVLGIVAVLGGTGEK